MLFGLEQLGTSGSDLMIGLNLPTPGTANKIIADMERDSVGRARRGSGNGNAVGGQGGTGGTSVGTGTFQFGSFMESPSNGLTPKFAQFHEGAYTYTLQ